MKQMCKALVAIFLFTVSLSVHAQTADDYRAKAKSGDAYAQYSLGWCYEYGKGVAQDYSQAVYWYKKSAEQGKAYAQYALGWCYEYGEGGTLDMSQAIYWYKKAAEQGNAGAQRRLGWLYETFQSGEKDISQSMQQALYWYKKGAEQGDTKSICCLANLYSKGHGTAQDVEKVTQLLEALAANGDTIAQKEVNRLEFGLTNHGVINDNTFVVVLSNNSCDNWVLDYSFGDDLLFFRRFCTTLLGIPENHCHWVYNTTLANMIVEFEWLQKVLEAYEGEAKAIIYYAGPGTSDESTQETFILPADGDAFDPSSGFSLKELYEMLGNMPAKSIMVFLDACFNGANRSGEMIASARGVKIKAKSTVPTGNIVVFNASQNDETAWKDDESNHGLFTYNVLKALKDSNGNITLGELSQKVISNIKKKVIVEKGVSQTPVILASPKVGDDWKNWKFKQ